MLNNDIKVHKIKLATYYQPVMRHFLQLPQFSGEYSSSFRL